MFRMFHGELWVTCLCALFGVIIGLAFDQQTEGACDNKCYMRVTWQSCGGTTTYCYISDDTNCYMCSGQASYLCVNRSDGSGTCKSTGNDLVLFTVDGCDPLCTCPKSSYVSYVEADNGGLQLNGAMVYHWICQ